MEVRMTWRVSTVVDERCGLVRALKAGDESVAVVCRRFGVSRQTAYKWLEREALEGETGLVDRSRRPKTSPRRTAPDMEERICGLRREHPAWGGRKLHHRLKKLGVEGVPSPSAITDILTRNHLLADDRRLKRDWQRFEAAHPNEMWQMDFKGDFALASGRCHTLTILDDHSRFNLCLQAYGDQRRGTVQEQLRRVFATYGLPETILVDNGPPWGNGFRPQPHTRLSAWLISLDVRVSHGRPYHPQTRGKDERFHRSLDEEVLLGQKWQDLSQVQAALDPWREVYNHERPHEALAYEVPSSRYRVSERELPQRPPAPDYLNTDLVRRVQALGEISFRGKTLRIGKAFSGQPVALRAEDDGLWEVYYYNQRVRRVDLRSSLDV
jgi:transposase InsO family protein